MDAIDHLASDLECFTGTGGVSSQVHDSGRSLQFDVRGMDVLIVQLHRSQEAIVLTAELGLPLHHDLHRQALLVNATNSLRHAPVYGIDQDRGVLICAWHTHLAHTDTRQIIDAIDEVQVQRQRWIESGCLHPGETDGI